MIVKMTWHVLQTVGKCYFVPLPRLNHNTDLLTSMLLIKVIPDLSVFMSLIKILFLRQTVLINVF